MTEKRLMDINDVRTLLGEEIDKLRNEETTPNSVNAVTNAVGKILTTVKMEMEYGKMQGVTPSIDFIKITPMKQRQLSGEKK